MKKNTYKRLATEAFGIREAPTNAIKPGAPISQEPEQPPTDQRTVPTGAPAAKGPVGKNPSSHEKEYTKDLEKMAEPSAPQSQSKLGKLLLHTFGQDKPVTEAVSKMKDCPRCGKTVMEPSEKCSQCGKKIVWEATEPKIDYNKPTSRSPVAIRTYNYREKPGFLITGGAAIYPDGPSGKRKGNSVSIFTHTRKSADHIKKLVQAGKDTAVGDFGDDQSKWTAEGVSEDSAPPSLSHGGGTSSTTTPTQTYLPKGNLSPEEIKVIDGKEKAILGFAKTAFAGKPLALALKAIRDKLEAIGIANNNSGKVADALAKLFKQDGSPETHIYQRVLPRIAQIPNVKGGGFYTGGSPGAFQSA